MPSRSRRCGPTTLAQQFDNFYEIDDPDTAEEYLRRWIVEVDNSGLDPLQKFARMLEDHWLGVIRWRHSRVSNGRFEGLNSLIQAAKRRARGYRTNRNYITIIYLIASKLDAGPMIAQATRNDEEPPRTRSTITRARPHTAPSRSSPLRI